MDVVDEVDWLPLGGALILIVETGQQQQMRRQAEVSLVEQLIAVAEIRSSRLG